MSPSAYKKNITRMFERSEDDEEARLACIQALSQPRLSSYRRFFAAKDDAEVLGLYQWNDDLSALLFRTISWVEVVLRNQFHRALSLRYGVQGTPGSRDWYLHVSLDARSLSKIEDLTRVKHRRHRPRLRLVPGPDDVISGLTFGFWPHLLDLETDLESSPVNWGPILVDVLPGHRQRQAAYWTKLKHRDALFARLDLCNELRNRIAHHEPIWKLGALLHESRPRHGTPVFSSAPPPCTPAESLVRLRLIYDRVVELLGWLSPAIARRHMVSETHLRCLNMLRPCLLHAYRRQRPPAKIDLAKVVRLRVLRKALRHAARRKQPVAIVDGHRVVGHLDCTMP